MYDFASLVSSMLFWKNVCQRWFWESADSQHRDEVAKLGYFEHSCRDEKKGAATCQKLGYFRWFHVAAQSTQSPSF